MRFIKENPALAAGIGLPILLMVLFGLAALIPQYTVDPPRYAVLFTTRQYDYSLNHNVQVNVRNNHVQMEYSSRTPPPPSREPRGNDRPYLYLFDPITMAVKEISFPLLQEETEIGMWREIPIPELQDLVVDTSSKAPDGYEFGRSNSRGGMGWPFFFGGGYENSLVLTKNGRTVRIPSYKGNDSYHYYQAKFLGWVIPQGAKP